MSLIKGLSKTSDNGSNSSNGGGSGNNSDNSALVSLGNTSFGFNFDSEEGTMNNSPRNSNNSEEGDSDGSQNNQAGAAGKPKSTQGSQVNQGRAMDTSTQKIKSGTSTPGSASQNDAAAAAAAAVANLQSIATKAAENGKFTYI